MMDAFDRVWQWANKPLESPLTIPAERNERSWSSLLKTEGPHRSEPSRSAHIPNDERLRCRGVEPVR